MKVEFYLPKELDMRPKDLTDAELAMVIRTLGLYQTSLIEKLTTINAQVNCYAQEYLNRTAE